MKHLKKIFEQKVWVIKVPDERAEILIEKEGWEFISKGFYKRIMTSNIKADIKTTTTKKGKPHSVRLITPDHSNYEEVRIKEKNKAKKIIKVLSPQDLISKNE